MGTGFSLDPNEYHAAANVIEGYGAIQAEHGATLSAGTSTPLSSSGTGISGAISQIAMGTVQKIVTDVTSTTKGFADDTAKGLRTQADNVSQLETELAGRSKSILSDAQSTLLGGSYAMSGYAMGAMSSASSPSSTSYGSGGMPTTFGSPMTTSAPLSESSPSEAELSAPTSSEAALSGAGAVAQEESQQSAMMPFGQMHGSTGAASAAGGAEERGQRPDYLKSKTELTDTGGDRVKAAIDAHLKECGMAPIPLSPSRLVCAKCGSMLEIEDAEALTA